MCPVYGLFFQHQLCHGVANSTYHADYHSGSVVRSSATALIVLVSHSTSCILDSRGAAIDLAQGAFAILISAINCYRVRFNRPLASLPLNLVFDFVIFAFGIPYACSGLAASISPYGYCSYYDDGLCDPYELAVTIVASITMAFGLTLG